MKNIVIIFMVLFLVLPLMSDKKQKMDEKEMMKKWMEIATPGPMHKMLAERVGKFKTKGKMWMKPGDPSSDTIGTAVGEMILGGRYLQIKYKGEVNKMPFAGMTIAAYDNFQKSFISTWIDNLGTGIFISYGKLDKTGKILTEIGDMDDIMTGIKTKFKIVNIKLDADNFKMIMYNVFPGKKEFKTMEMTYTRIK